MLLSHSQLIAVLVTAGLLVGNALSTPTADPHEHAHHPPHEKHDDHDHPLHHHMVPGSEIYDADGVLRAFEQPHGKKLCASGCALSKHPTPPLERDRFLQLIAAYADEPVAGGEAQDALLFYGPQTLERLAWVGDEQLSADRVAQLRRELSKTHVVITLRVIDADDRVRVALPATRVPLDRRQVFGLDKHDVPGPLEMSGTVKRVGQRHLWQRL